MGEADNKPKQNPYLKSSGGVKAPLVFRLPVFDFESGAEVEQQLLRGEACAARIPNPRVTGFVQDVALVFKDEKDRVYSIPFVQHHGVLKETEENMQALFGKDGKPLPDDKGDQDENR